MSAKAFAVLVAPILVLVLNVSAQVNQVSVTVGRTFVSTQSVATGDEIHFGNPVSFALNYSRLLMTHKIFGLYAELPVGIYPKMDLNYPLGGIPKDVGALFVTPSVRLNFFSADSVSPWVSAGGGYGRFRNASSLYPSGDPNPGPSGTNTGVLQVGAGLDVWFWHDWGARFEARDFYSGAPDLNVDTGRSRQHNYYVGFGVARRF